MTSTKKTKKPPAQTTTPQHAEAVDEKDALVARLKRIEGQVRGLQKMVEDERYCKDVLDQVASVQQALRGVTRVLVKNHLHHCASSALSSDDETKREAMIEELLEMIGR